jgi:hypothetical protein
VKCLVDLHHGHGHHDHESKMPLRLLPERRVVEVVAVDEMDLLPTVVA